LITSAKEKKGPAKNLQQNKEKKTKGYNANSTSTHLPPLELMPCNAFLMYGTVFQGALF